MWLRSVCAVKRTNLLTTNKLLFISLCIFWSIRFDSTWIRRVRFSYAVFTHHRACFIFNALHATIIHEHKSIRWLFYETHQLKWNVLNLDASLRDNWAVHIQQNESTITFHFSCRTFGCVLFLSVRQSIRLKSNGAQLNWDRSIGVMSLRMVCMLLLRCLFCSFFWGYSMCWLL